jgi:rfaE bifunctional protein kinase chain/domain
MKGDRFDAITSRYSNLRIALVGDFCLDRYLEIDPARKEISIETGLPVHNVVRVRSQPGAAGTILNNLVALEIETIYPIGFCGVDGEGFELQRALGEKRGVRLDFFLETPERRTFTYCKPLMVEAAMAPRELNRLDSKNWSVTPRAVEEQLVASIKKVAHQVDALIVLDQVDIPETGVVTKGMLSFLGEMARQSPGVLIMADSRRGLRDYPAVAFKMNRAELAALTGKTADLSLENVKCAASELARRNQRPVFVTLSEQGILGAAADGSVDHTEALPVGGEIDVVGAGDAVMANLATAIAAGATIREAIELANAAASIVIHQLGTTGTADRGQLRDLVAAS